MAKVEVVKSEKADKPNYTWAIFIIIFAVLVVGCLFIPALTGGNSSNLYLNAKLADCPSITLKEGLDKVSNHMERYSYGSLKYKVEEGTSADGKKRMYLTISDYGYTTLELNGDTVSLGDYVYDGDAPNTKALKALLCGKEN